MLWWTYQQLRTSNPKTRLATVEKLAQSDHSDSVEPLLFALKDGDTTVRSTAARALGRHQDRRAVDPLTQMLRDSAPTARAAAAEALGQLGDPQAVNSLLRLLRDIEPSVRSRASQSLKQLGWQPGSDTERALQIMATGNLRQAAALGSEAIGPLLELLRNGPPDKQVAAVKVLGEMDDRSVIKPLLEALRKNAPAVRIAALEALERFGDPSSFDDTTRMLRDHNSGVRSAAVEVVAKCDGGRAVPELIQALNDPSWEVRQAAVKALGTVGDPAAVDGLCYALRDKDRDVREGAAMALGRIGDARAIYFLVLASLDIETNVRNAASNSLRLIDRHWLETDAARQAMPEIETALNHREYWVRHSATKLLEQLNSVVPQTQEYAPPSTFAVSSASAPAKQYQVLFVDDDVDFLAMIRDFFAALANQAWQIHCATSAGQALELLKIRAIDLVVTDVNMPMLDGIQFLHILNRSHPDLKKAVITSDATEERRSACLAEGAELFIEKPRMAEGLKSIFVMLEELITWTPREGFQGVLRRVGLQDVIQMECLGRTSSILEVHHPHLAGRIYIEEGRIIHAQAGKLTGEEAFYKLLTLPSGEFQLNPFEPPPQRTIEAQWEFLLMETARTRDEMASQASV